MFTESLKANVLRFTIYVFLIFSMTSSLPIIAQNSVDFFKEHGTIEWLQITLLASAGAIFIAGSFLITVYRQLFLMLASGISFAIIREMDAILDDLIPFVGWKIGVLILLYAGHRAHEYRDVLRLQTTQFIRSRAFAVLWAGFVIAVPFAQLTGHGPFLEVIMGDDYIRAYKRIIEESAEFMGYLLILIGSVESIVQMRRPAWRPTEDKDVIQQLRVSI